MITIGIVLEGFQLSACNRSSTLPPGNTYMSGRNALLEWRSVIKTSGEVEPSRKRIAVAAGTGSTDINLSPFGP